MRICVLIRIVLVFIVYSSGLQAQKNLENSASRVKHDFNIFLDINTGLMWQDDRMSINLKRDWKTAKSYCEKLVLDSYTDWYLPKIDELETLSDIKKHNPAVVSGIKNISNSAYWSSSSFAKDSKLAWYSWPYNGNSALNKKTTKISVRCARKRYPLFTMNFDNRLKSILDTKLTLLSEEQPEYSSVKGMFESKEEFEQRINSKEFKIRVERIKREAIKETLEVVYGKPLLTDLRYKAETAEFFATLRFESNTAFRRDYVAIKVPKNEAKAFYQLAKHNVEALFEYDNKGLRLTGVEIIFKDKSYVTNFAGKKVNTIHVALDIPNIEIAKVAKHEKTGFKDLDILLENTPKVKVDRTKWLFVIGIEQYEYTDNIAYAKRSAEMFVKTAQKTLGIIKENSYVMIDTHATQTHIKTNMKKMLRRVKPGDSIYFYYNGHGIPIPAQNNAPYILSYETEPDFVQDEHFFSLQNIYIKLSESKADKVIAIVDSCFSGITDAKAILKGVAATRIVAKSTNFNKEKMVVLSAGKGNQYSNPYNEKRHRLFSFYVMKNILEGSRDIKTLYKKTKAQTYQTSLEEYGDGRTQDPTLEGNARLKF